MGAKPTTLSSGRHVRHLAHVTAAETTPNTNETGKKTKATVIAAPICWSPGPLVVAYSKSPITRGTKLPQGSAQRAIPGWTRSMFMMPNYYSTNRFVVCRSLFKGASFPGEVHCYKAVIRPTGYGSSTAQPGLLPNTPGLFGPQYRESTQSGEHPPFTGQASARSYGRTLTRSRRRPRAGPEAWPLSRRTPRVADGPGNRPALACPEIQC